MSNEEKAKIYDELVNATLCNIYSMSKTSGAIVLENFDPNNQEHLFFFEVALMARELYNFSFYIDTDFINWIKINWRIRKVYNKVKKMKETTPKWKIPMEEILEYERKYGNEKLQAKKEDRIFADIYKAYYERV